MRQLNALAATLCVVLSLGTIMVPEPADAQQSLVQKPIVIGHRGASGYIPEHTIAAYSIAIEQGADFIEPDLVMTKDGVLVARHENEIGGTTDVANRPEFASRFTTKVIDGQTFTGWFTEDFTLAELKTLRARERLPDVRPGSTRFDGDFTIPTFEEILSFLRATNERLRNDARRAGQSRFRQIGIYPETKHPTYHRELGFAMEEAVVDALRAHRFLNPQLVYIQSFEVSNLKRLSRLTRLPLVQLINASGKPYDFVVAGDPRTYADLATLAGLAEIATYAKGVGVNKNVLFPRDANGNIGQPSRVIEDAHTVGLLVHGWTFREENQFLPKNFQVGTDPKGAGDLAGEITLFLSAGMDGFFTDHPDVGVAARDGFLATP